MRNQETPEQIERTLEEQALMRDAIQHPGMKLLFQKLHTYCDTMRAKQLNLDPYSQAAEIKRCQEFHHVVKEFLPQVIEGLVNYDLDSPDRQLPAKSRWSLIKEWFTKKGK